ncbi:dipeptidyl aminopeptidase/acylaminoacyl peptidase [Balneicella halophila]|uniref:Dipeptidyl aminopeptidase/acylaminoacyl peptidase n=1 Tax=Balneicella halophila TaxID=1537566 RepID=A0A7L4UPQ0_BALHA|nr:prolyl oligopeptidase family serine peptidase [Balneicella halophila]PVX50857.1 dipeptidyl aminopeptidase/acylaminoacyl peptidase [Balneicella halophila]
MKLKLVVFTLLIASVTMAQEKLTYQKPPKEILELVDVPRAPSVNLDAKGETMVMFYRDSYKTLEELSQKELRLGGLRIDPKTNIGSRVTYSNNIKIQKVNSKEAKQVKGLPENARLTNFLWSPDQSKMSFTNTVENGVELWILDIETATAKKISEPTINANMGGIISWFNDNASLLVAMLPANRKPLIDAESVIPEGPTVTESTGAKAQNRTYQDLLQNNNDEQNFETLATSELYKIDIDGNKTKWKEAAMYSDASFSPDGNYVMVTTIKRPFSYIVPFYRFPQTVTLYKSNGEQVQVVNKVPLDEVRPQGFMATRKGKRNISWRADKPATLVWAEALDEGDPEKKVDFRDELFTLEAPFNQQPKSLFKTKDRYAGITWGNDNTAIVVDYWWNTRNIRTYLINPSKSEQAATVLFDRNYQDKYNDPGEFARRKNQFGKYVLDLNKDKAYLIGDGFSKEGQFPFVDEINLKTKETKRLYQSNYNDKLENLLYAIDMKKGKLLVRIESPTEYPNYYIRNIKKNNSLQQITFFENPFKSIQDVHKEVIRYKREDGLELSGTLYLPVGYDLEKKEKMPMVMWAYPTEFKDKSSAGQTTSNPNEFIYPYYGSMVYWVTRGYVVLDDASFPIVGEGDEEPNDTFMPQLVANAKAAIDAVDSLGYIDRDRVAVGGHSYGAFMTANLLTHSDLFAAGIARSGAYNRTLTPFGFQSEERNYWEAPDVYNAMSPFMHVDKMKTPLLLIHGTADNNSGTYPLQSERYFNALKGFGAPTRLVMLPKESHSYRAKKSILHLLWEQDQWLEKYVKNRKK